MRRLVDFGACKFRLTLPDSSWPLWLIIGGGASTESCIMKLIILNQSYLYCCLIHLMQAKKVTLQTAVGVT